MLGHDLGKSYLPSPAPLSSPKFNTRTPGAYSKIYNTILNPKKPSFWVVISTYHTVRLLN